MQRTPRTVNCEHDCEGDLPRSAKRRQERHSRGENRTVHYLRALLCLNSASSVPDQLLKTAVPVGWSLLGTWVVIVDSCSRTRARAERCAVKRPKLHGCVSNVKVPGFGK